MKISKFTVVVMGLLLVGLCVSPAPADIINVSISSPNSALSGFTGPYANVEINRTSATQATITFTSLTNGGFTYLMAGQGAADLNVNGTYTLGAVTLSNSIAGFSAPSLVGNTPGNVDGFGTFNLSLNLFDGFTHSATSIMFALTDTSGTWATASDVLTANSNGAFAAIHGFAAASPVNVSAGAAATGFASNGGGTSSVPEPTTLLLLGSGLVGLGFRRFRK